MIDREDDTPTSGADTSDMDGITKTGNGEISAAHAESIIEVLMSIPDVDTAPKGTTTEEPMANSEPAIVQSTSHDLCPLFPHERLTRDDPSEAHHTRRKSSMSRAEEGRHQSPEYPQLEVFPSGTGPILKRIATTKSQLDADETTDETLSAEEDIRVTELVNSPTFSHERCPAEQSILYRVRTPSPSPLPPSISPTLSYGRKHPDMDVISEQEDMFSSDEDWLVAKDLHGTYLFYNKHSCQVRNSLYYTEGTLKSNVHKVHDLAGVDGCADLQPIEEEHAMDASRYPTVVTSGYNLHIQGSIPDSFDPTISHTDEDERQPLLNRSGTVQGDYPRFPRVSFNSEGARKRRDVIDSSTTAGSDTSEVTAIPVPFYVTLWLWCLHYLSSAFAIIFRRGKEY